MHRAGERLRVNDVAYLQALDAPSLPQSVIHYLLERVVNCLYRCIFFYSFFRIQNVIKCLRIITMSILEQIINDKDNSLFFLTLFKFLLTFLKRKQQKKIEIDTYGEGQTSKQREIKI